MGDNAPTNIYEWYMFDYKKYVLTMLVQLTINDVISHIVEAFAQLWSGSANSGK